VAGLIARLFGGKPRPPDPNPLPGLGGYQMPPGPAGQTGYPGSTTSTRTFGRNTSPRVAKIDANRLGGINQGLGSTPETRQHSYRGDLTGAATDSPRTTPVVTTPQTVARQELQHNSDREFYGGPMLRTGTGNNTAGANPLSPAHTAGGHSGRDTETPPVHREPVIGTNVPGAQNVRNTRAVRYQFPGGQPHTYRSAPNPVAPPQDVTVTNRFVYPGGGNTTWSVERLMPYTGRGDGARGADLNGNRYYSTGVDQYFQNAGAGDYGIARQRGGDYKRPVAFTEPAPWTKNFYDTTDSVGTVDTPGSGGQAPQAVYYSPSAGRASNTTGRTH
jgi:hypothetical protein